MNGRRAISTLLASLGLLGLAASGAQASSTCPGLNGRLAAAVGAGSGAQVEIVGPWTGTAAPLFAPLGEGVSLADPSFSCDGSEVVYGGSAGGTGFIEVADSRSGAKVTSGATSTAAFPQPPFPMSGMSPAEPAFLRSGKLVFTSLPVEGGAPAGTYIARPDGSGLHRLFGALSAAVSNDGRWFLAGPAGQPLSVRDARGRQARWSHLRLGAASNPTFSASGDRVAFQRANDIYVVDTDGSYMQRLTRDGRSGNPVFSPNGQWVAFTRWRATPGRYEEIMAISLERSPVLRVVARLPGVGGVGQLAWSPR